MVGLSNTLLGFSKAMTFQTSGIIVEENVNAHDSHGNQLLIESPIFAYQRDDSLGLIKVDEG